MDLNEIQHKFKKWSFDNFGEQVSKQTGQTLGSLLPLLGIGEEVGELDAAIEENNEAEIRDALGDIMIYLMDFCNREQVLIYECIPRDTIMVKPTTFSRALGRLNHVMLKRHQGIRGYDDDNFFFEERNKAIFSLYNKVVAVSYDFGIDPYSNIEAVAEKVLGRDWKANPEGAGNE